MEVRNRTDMNYRAGRRAESTHTHTNKTGWTDGKDGDVRERVKELMGIIWG